MLPARNFRYTRKHNKETNSPVSDFQGKSNQIFFSPWKAQIVINKAQKCHKILTFLQKVGQILQLRWEIHSTKDRGDCVTGLDTKVIQILCFSSVFSETSQWALIIPRLSRFHGGWFCVLVCFAISTTLLCSQSRDALLCIFSSPSFPFTPSSFFFLVCLVLHLSPEDSAGSFVAAESGFPSFPLSQMPPPACLHLHLSRTPTGDTFLLPMASRLEKAVARGALTNKARFGAQGPWCILLFIPLHAHLCVCYNDFRGLSARLNWVAFNKVTLRVRLGCSLLNQVFSSFRSCFSIELMLSKRCPGCGV